MNNSMLPLKNYDLFARLSDKECEELEFLHHSIEAKKGDYIYFESQYLNKLFYLKEGNIKVGYIDNNGNEIVKEIIQPGELFGQCSLETKDMNGEFALAYKSDVSLCAFTIENFKKILQKNTSIAIGYSQKMAGRLRKIENRLVSMLHADVKTRLMRFFYDMILSNNDLLTGNTIIIDNFLTHDDIARLIGSTRQTVTTCFNEPEILSMMRITRRHIVITDIKGVKLLADY